MSLSCVLFERNASVVVLSPAFQIAHGPFIVAILAHNNPQSGGLRFGFFPLLLVLLFVLVTVVMTL